MTILPIIVREMRIAAGRRWLHWLRVLAGALAVGVLAWLLLVDTTGAYKLSGRQLLHTLATVALFYCLIAGTVTTADAVSRERREGTLGLLFLTDLRSQDIVLGKLSVAALPLISAVIGLLPMLAVSLLVGGVNLADVGLMALVLANTLFTALSIGLFISTFSSHESRAYTAAILVPLGLAFGPYVAGQLLFGAEDRESFTQLPTAVLLPSPLFGLGLIHDESVPVFRLLEFSLNLAVVQGIGWLFLAGAGTGITRLVREGAHREWLQRLEHRARDWVFGAGEYRARRRSQLLDVNPILWLASRHRHKSGHLWLFVLSLAAIAVWSGAQTRGLWFEWKPALAYLLIVHGALKLCFLSEACHRLGADAQRGAFELLLTTPTEVETLARGHALALRRTFAGPLSALVALDCLWLWLDCHQSEPDHDRWISAFLLGVILTALFTDLAAIQWMSLWQTLASPTSAHATQACVLRVLLLPWLAFLGMTVPAGWVGLGNASARGREAVVTGLLAALWLGCSLINAAWWRWRGQSLFLHRCRRVAAEGLVGSNFPPGAVAREILDALRANWRMPFSRSYWRRHPVLSIATGSLLAGVIALAAVQGELQRQIARDIARLRDQGIPVDPRELEAWQPRPGTNENAAHFLRIAIDGLRVATGARPDPIVLPSRSGPLTVQQRAGYEALLRTNAPALTATEQALAVPDAWFDPERQFALSPGRFRGSLPLRLNGLLLARTTLRIEDGQLDAACDGLLQALRLAEIVGRQPRCLGQNVRHACIHQVLDSLERLLARTELRADQLDRLSLALGSADTAAPLIRALVGEQWLILDAWRHQRYGFSAASSSGSPRSDLPEILLRWFGRVSGMAGGEFRSLLGSTGLLGASLKADEFERFSLGRTFRDSPSHAGTFFPDSSSPITRQ